MKIIIIGDGKVGHTLATQLVNEQHEITMIDTDPDVLSKCQDDLDVLCIKGKGANASVLLQAEADKADVLISTTGSDETNMLCCLIANHLGAKYTIARIRDPEYIESQLLLQNQLGIDLVINPERATAAEISVLLRYPFASRIEAFAKGRVEMVQFTALESDPFIGVPLKQINNLPKILYAIVERGDKVIIPNGNFSIQVDDKVCVFGDVAKVTEYFNAIHRYAINVRNVAILGASRIAFYLSKIIVPLGVHVNIFEKDPEIARQFAEKQPKANVVCGDGTDPQFLDEQGIASMDAFVSLTDRDEENLMTGMYASRVGVPKVISKNSRLYFTDIFMTMGVGSIVSPQVITSSIILRVVRALTNKTGDKIEKVYKLIDGRAEITEFKVEENDQFIGIPIKLLRIKPGTIIAIILRQDRVIIPFGNDYIEKNDHVVIITRDPGIIDLNEVITK